MLQLTPQKAAALSVLLAADNNKLVRRSAGFVPPHGDAAAVTMRTARALDVDGLAEFDDPYLPSELLLTRKGREAAQRATAPRTNA